MKFPYSPHLFICNYGKAKYIPISFKDECINTARLLSQEAKTLGRVPTICLSGGLDSEVIVKSFLDAGEPFKLATFEFPNKLNEHEIAYTKMFCNEHQLETEYYPIDIASWIASAEAEKMFVETKAQYLPYVSHMKLISHIWENNGFPIVGEEGQLERLEGFWHYVEHEHDRTLYRYADLHGIEGSMGFLQHTPEMLLAMFQDPLMEELGTRQNKLANILLYTSREIKYRMYVRCWPDLKPRTKMTGAERIGKLVDERTFELFDKYGGQENRDWIMPYYGFVKSLLPDKYKNKE